MPSLAVETRHVLRAHGLHPRKTLGQNFIIDSEALQSVVRAPQLTTHDRVVEIGAGLGTLTLALAERCAQVVAVELDRALAEVLSSRTAAVPGVTVVHGNALDLDLALWLPADQPYKLVANIPYFITGQIIRHFLTGPRRPGLLVLMVQKEVAQRLVAQPGDLSLLGVTTQYYAKTEIVRTVPARSFWPAPAVDSAIVRLRPHATMPVQVDDERRFFSVVRAGFGEKRKQLHNALVHGLAHIPAPGIDAALAAAGIDRTRRAETLSLQEWGLLYREIELRWPGARKARETGA